MTTLQHAYFSFCFQKRPLGFFLSFLIYLYCRYLGASFDVPSLVDKLLQQLASKQTIVVNLYDTTNLSSPIKMYGPDVSKSSGLHISHVDFGDPLRKHEMHCR